LTRLIFPKATGEATAELTIVKWRVPMETCPDAEWWLLVSLWRYAELRKMEVFELTLGGCSLKSGTNEGPDSKDNAP